MVDLPFKHNRQETYENLDFKLIWMSDGNVAESGSLDCLAHI